MCVFQKNRRRQRNIYEGDWIDGKKNGKGGRWPEQKSHREKRKQKMIVLGIEPRTFRVLGECDNRYTIQPTMHNICQYYIIYYVEKEGKKVF